VHENRSWGIISATKSQESHELFTHKKVDLAEPERDSSGAVRRFSAVQHPLQGPDNSIDDKEQHKAENSGSLGRTARLPSTRNAAQMPSAEARHHSAGNIR
jgi:hypothetical protein